MNFSFFEAEPKTFPGSSERLLAWVYREDHEKNLVSFSLKVTWRSELRLKYKQAKSDCFHFATTSVNCPFPALKYCSIGIDCAEMEILRMADHSAQSGNMQANTLPSRFMYLYLYLRFFLMWHRLQQPLRQRRNCALRIEFLAPAAPSLIPRSLSNS